MHPRIQELVNHLAAHRNDVHEAVATVPPEMRERRPAADRWSVAEVLEHLSLIEHRVAGLLTKYVDAGRARGLGAETDTSSVVKTFNVAGVIDRSSPVSAPEGVIPRQSLDIPAATAALETSRAALLQALQNADGLAIGELSHPHPVLGTLNLYHWIVALGAHDSRHAAQIREIGHTFAAH